MPPDRSDITLVILPGFDGTGQLSAEFERQIPSEIDVCVAEYPPDRLLDMEGLADHVEGCIPPGRSVVLLAVSFSGPVAIRMLDRRRHHYLGALFCVTFATPPRPFLLQLCRWIPFGWIVRNLILTSAAVVRHFFFFRRDTAEHIRLFQRAARKPSAEVITGRLRILAEADEREALARVDIPCCYIRASGDRMIPGRNVQPFLENLRDLEVRTIEGPHCLLLSHPAESWMEVERFLARLIAHSD